VSLCRSARNTWQFCACGETTINMKPSSFPASTIPVAPPLSVHIATDSHREIPNRWIPLHSKTLQPLQSLPNFTHRSN
jgi:hypothetical protein